MSHHPVTVTTPSDREVVVSRRFDAPPQLVFEAHTRPELILQWLTGPPEWPIVSCEIDLRVGGTLRYVWRHDSGKEMGLTGVFREIAPPERLVHTEIFDQDWTGGETLVTTRFEANDGGTLLSVSVLYASKEDRDGALATGMTDGMGQAYDRLDALFLTRGDPTSPDRSIGVVQPPAG